MYLQVFNGKVVVIYVVFAKIFHTLSVSDQLCIYGFSWKITDTIIIVIVIVYERKKIQSKRRASSSYRWNTCRCIADKREICFNIIMYKTMIQRRNTYVQNVKKPFCNLVCIL